MNWIKNFGAAAVVALGMLFGIGSANALLITTQNASTTSGTFDVTCGACNGGTPSSTLSATIAFSDFVFTNGGATLTTTVTVTNTTPTSVVGESITDFGFNTTPDATSVSDTSSVYNTLTERNFPGFNTVDVCATAVNNANNCAGGSNGGLFSGQSETFTMTFNGLSGSLDIGTDILGGVETVDVKFAGTLSSFEGSGGLCTPGAPGCFSGPPTTVPEPTSLALFGTALVAFGIFAMFWRRRKQNGSDLPTGMAA